ncbi:hypothetical protein B0H21DRAFT_224202 [Amylocystis lapponica]|nr:hypothetical protein B0H21DRAFT_224202 [Amylocystis lapponica]
MSLFGIQACGVSMSREDVPLRQSPCHAPDAVYLREVVVPRTSQLPPEPRRLLRASRRETGDRGNCVRQGLYELGAKKPTTDGVCPGSPVTQFHTTGLSDVKGCALAIAYKSDVTQVQPEDFTVFSVNQTCVWTRETNFPVPAKMPACPAGGCTWPSSGSIRPTPAVNRTT